MPNKDGLEPGQSVDFQTMVRVNRERQSRNQEPVKQKRKAVKDERQAEDTEADY